MAADQEYYVLRTTLTSPFGRKARMAAEVLDLARHITIEPGDPLDAKDTLRVQNPLGKMPCLVLAGGDTIYDSGVIIEFLQQVAGGDQLVPASGLPRIKALTRATLADGITEAALLVIYENRFRDPGTHSERWLTHQRGKIMRGLAAFEAAPPDPAKIDIVSLGLSCALGYLDWRKPVDWRPGHPNLAAWLTAFADNEPSFERTRAPNS